MSNLQGICLIGDVVIDITLQKSKKSKLRLGGIVHAARGLWALDSNYFTYYFSPEYLDEQIHTYLNHHGCNELVKIGNVIGAPYIFFINEPKETKDQGYEFILKDEIKTQFQNSNLKELKKRNYKDIIIISGNYSINEIADNINQEANIHIDLSNNINDIGFLSIFKKKFKTLFLSTSSSYFQKNYNGDFLRFADKFAIYTDVFVLKENRGGSRAIDFQNKKAISIPSQTRPIQHSIGVGDVFASSYVVNSRKYSTSDSLILSSWIAAEYASTTYPDDFKKEVKKIISSNVNELKDLGGTILHWEDRKLINIYIAAPDFDYLDTYFIEEVYNCLLYHNFNPRRPIKENGQMEENASFSRKQELFLKDMALLESCQLLLAVLLKNDPGTLIEIGIASRIGIPTLVYDPYNIAKNCMLTQLPDLITNEIDEIIAEVFNFGSKIIIKK